MAINVSLVRSGIARVLDTAQITKKRQVEFDQQGLVRTTLQTVQLNRLRNQFQKSRQSVLQ